MSDAGADGRSRLLRTLSAAVAGAALLAAVALTATPPSPDGPDPRLAPSAPASPRLDVEADGRPSDTDTQVSETRLAGTLALLDRRARAVLTRDRADFLATVDPEASRFRQAQARLFDALRRVPLGDWRYRLDAVDDAVPVSAAVRERVAADEVWIPVVTVEYALAGFDVRPARLVQALTLARRGTAWYVAGDADSGPVRTERALWDFGEVRAVHGRQSLVLGHEEPRLLRRIAREVDAAVPRVAGLWGNGWLRRVVVLVPGSQRELSALLGGDSRLDEIAALATVETGWEGSRTTPGGDRVLVNPTAFDRLDAIGRRVVITHEVTHVATRTVTEAGVPAWLSEGFADYVAFRGTGQSTRTVAAELATAVRAGRGPRSLPGERDFDTGSARLPEAYQAAWLACRTIADRWGERALVRFYRAVGTAAGGDRDGAVAVALKRELGTTPAAFTEAWRGHLTAELR